MAKEITENTPDSHVVFGKKRSSDIRGYAETKFGKSFQHVKVDRENECFVVFVKNVDSSDKKEFEQLWTMCKVLTVIE